MKERSTPHPLSLWRGYGGVPRVVVAALILLASSASLVAQTLPAPLSHTLNGFYWSPSTFAEDPSAAWQTLMKNGFTFKGNKAGVSAVWPVRNP
jgi:hypothetical protein